MDMIRFTLIILLVSLVSCKSKTLKDSKHESHLKKSNIDSMEIIRPSYWVFGMPDVKDWQRQIIAHNLRFRYKIIAGDALDSKDSIPEKTEKHNRITDSVLSKRIGKNWYKLFESKVDSLYSLDSLAISIAKSNHYIASFDKKTEIHNDKYDFYSNLDYTSYATQNGNIKVVEITGYGVAYGRLGHLNYMRITVDLEKRKVINIDSTAYGN